MEKSQFRQTFLTLSQEFPHLQHDPNEDYETFTVASEQFISKLDQHHKDNIEKIQEYHHNLNGMIEGIDQKLNRVFQQSQKDFLQGYQVWLRRKDEEFKCIVDKLQKKLNDKNHLEEKIEQLVIQLKTEKDKSLEVDNQKEKYKKQVKDYKRIAIKLKEEIVGYKQSAMDDQRRIKQLEKEIQELREQISELTKENENLKHQLKLKEITLSGNKVMNDNLKEIQTINQYVDFESMQLGHEGNITKFQQFLDDIFSSGIKTSQIKQELISYFEIIDLGYRSKILKLQTELNLANGKTSKLNKISSKSTITTLNRISPVKQTQLNGNDPSISRFLRISETSNDLSPIKNNTINYIPSSEKFNKIISTQNSSLFGDQKTGRRSQMRTFDNSLVPIKFPQYVLPEKQSQRSPTERFVNNDTLKRLSPSRKHLDISISNANNSRNISPRDVLPSLNSQRHFDIKKKLELLDPDKSVRIEDLSRRISLGVVSGNQVVTKAVFHNRKNQKLFNNPQLPTQLTRDQELQ